jgi:branched-chain amino acid transport system ATP-binding protein
MAALLETKGLRVRYGNVEARGRGGHALPQGGIVTNQGAHAAGKSTTLRAITGLLRPSAGEIWYDGKPAHALPAHQLVRAGVAHAPEGRRVFGTLTVSENLGLGAFTRTDAAGIAETLRWVNELFPVLARRKNQLAGTLSGGEQQMLAIGRALMAKPQMLLLDEPSLGLAPLLVKAIFQTIRESNETAGVTVLLVEQNARAALKLAHRGYVMEVGKIVLQDAAASLASDPKVRGAYLGGKRA